MRSVTMRCPNCGFEGDVTKRTVSYSILAFVGLAAIITFLAIIFSHNVSEMFNLFLASIFVGGLGVWAGIESRKCPKCDFINTVQK